MSTYTFFKLSNGKVSPFHNDSSGGIKRYHPIIAKIVKILAIIFPCCTLGVTRFHDGHRVWQLDTKDAIRWLHSKSVQATKQDNIAGEILKVIDSTKNGKPAPKTTNSANKTPKAPLIPINTFLYQIESLPDAINYHAFNAMPLAKRTDTARDNLQMALFPLGYDASKNGLKWQLTTQFGKLDDTYVMKIGSFELTKEEILYLNSTLKISYRKPLNPDDLKKLLTKGAGNKDEKYLARYRMVSSEIALTCNADGTPINRKKNEPLHTFRMYTTNAPNLCYELLKQDKENLLKSDGTLNTTAYEAMAIDRLSHFLEDCIYHGVTIPVISGLGLGAFLKDFMKPDAQKCFREALAKVLLNLKQKNKFEAIIFATPDPNIDLDAFKVAVNLIAPSIANKFIISRKSSLDIAQCGATNNYRVGTLNPGDPSCIPGQFWDGGHVALEEMIALFSTMVLSQHPGANPKVSDDSCYRFSDPKSDTWIKDPAKLLETPSS